MKSPFLALALMAGLVSGALGHPSTVVSTIDATTTPTKTVVVMKTVTVTKHVKATNKVATVTIHRSGSKYSAVQAHQTPGPSAKPKTTVITRKVMHAAASTYAPPPPSSTSSQQQNAQPMYSSPKATTVTAPIATTPAAKPTPTPTPGAASDLNPITYSNPTLPSKLESSNQACLNAHNYYRLKGGVPLLTWDHNQYVKACQRAEENLALGGIILSHGDNTGENLWAGDAKNAPEDITCANAVINAWYPEIKDYRPGTKIPMSESEDPVAFKLFEAYGHYTQLVWPTSTKFGCCTRGNKIACTYDPAGNIAGRVAVE